MQYVHIKLKKKIITNMKKTLSQQKIFENLNCSQI